MPNLQILADENIPLVDELFGRIGTVRRVPGRAISREDVLSVDALLVRSVTRVDADLLSRTPVRFVGSATIGTDHIETDFLNQREIGWASAPGSNSDSVVEYVLAALLRMAVRRGRDLRGRTLGIIGCGSIGSRLAERAEALGLNVLRNDPPLQGTGSGNVFEFVSLQDVLAQSDIVTCHVPLERAGPHPTYHLMGRDELEAMKPGAWLINTSRGAVVDNAALLATLKAGTGPGGVVLDVWEKEPTPLDDLVRRVDIATPHIAGYSYEGKTNGTLMLLDALCAHFGIDRPDPSHVVDTSLRTLGAPDPTWHGMEWLDTLVRRMYDVAADDRRMRAHWPGDAEAVGIHFTGLRRDYPVRRSFGAHRVHTAQVPPKYHAPVAALGVRLTKEPIPEATRSSAISI